MKKIDFLVMKLLLCYEKMKKYIDLGLRMCYDICEVRYETDRKGLSEQAD